MIKAVQIDVNGLCNAGCWFCPVSYEGNPESARRDMTLEELESILIQLSSGKGDFVDPDLNLIYTANYNEVLLYKNFEEMLALYRKYGFKINILTNGVALTKSKVNLIKQNEDIINGILLNIPSGDRKRWAKYVNMNEKLFNKVISNTRYAIDSLSDMVKRKGIYLMINGLNEKSLVENGGWLDILSNAPDLDLDTNNGSLAQETEALKNLFPEIEIFPAHHLYDRAGHLESFNIIGQSNAIAKYLKPGNSKVIGCNGGIGVRSRTEEWIHVNPNGDLFICCADFDFKTVFGNLFKESLKDIWYGKKRQDAIKQSYSDMCTKCSAAIWGN
jgi:MoaA/NifB/PqqE/SkfB family radical SAM enzyme